MKRIFSFILILLAIILCSKVGFKGFLENPGVDFRSPQSSESENRRCVLGYLKKGSSWLDEYNNWNYNAENIRIEIWNKPALVMSDGTKLTQIYFLEGECAGVWGYTRKNFLLYDEP